MTDDTPVDNSGVFKRHARAKKQRHPSRTKRSLWKKGVQVPGSTPFKKGQSGNPSGLSRWQKGQSGNPQGKPKSVVALIYERTHNLEDLIDWLNKLFRGEDLRSAEEKTAGVKRMHITIGQRFDALRELLAYGAGRPKSYMEVSGKGGAPLQGATFNLALLSVPELRLLEILAKRTRGDVIGEHEVAGAISAVTEQREAP